MAKKKKQAVKKQKKFKPSFTPQDAQSIFEFWTHFEIPLTPALKELKSYLDNGGIITEEIENFTKRAVTSVIAARTDDAFMDDIWDKASIECAKVLAQMNKDKKL